MGEIATCQICKKDFPFILVPTTHINPETKVITVEALQVKFECGHHVFKLGFEDINHTIDVVKTLSSKISQLEKELSLLQTQK
jgi:hypothetical protein